MTVEYSLDENDFLTHQLYIASTSDIIRKKRQRNRVWVPLAYFAIGIMFFLFEDELGLLITFFVLAAIWYMAYPRWEKRYYAKHYKAFIKENYSDRFGKVAILELNNDFIVAKDNASESRILTTEVREIADIPAAIFLKLNGGQSLILPKDKISSIEALTANLQSLASHLNIEYKVDSAWEWK